VAIADARAASSGSAAAGADPHPPVALYVHFPFCLSICPYCDFVVYAGKAARGPASRIDALVRGLVAEVGLRTPAARSALDSVYLGGGTPSLMSGAQVDQLLDAIDRSFGIASGAEITIEANPGPADRGDLAGFRAAGVNRLSVGAQSMDQAELRVLGRRHSRADVVETLAAARRAGFDSISLDLLYDLPGQTTDLWHRTLADALALEPDHLSAYALGLDGASTDVRSNASDDHLPLRPGARRWRAEARRAQDDDRAAEMYELADELLGAAGFGWYELSNWARPGRGSRHNLAYWTGAAYEAVGPGAHAYDGALTRRWNAANLDGYLAALAGGVLPPGASERLDSATAAAERAILRLRTVEGVAVAQDGDPTLRTALAWGRSVGLLEPTAVGGLRLTLKGRLLSNELFVRLLPGVASEAGLTAAVARVSASTPG
jgi:oxygen-independent coproporphyrinogen-3 oxidase